jgi:hypothetical protein
MFKLTMFFLTVMLAFSFGCGEPSKEKTQVTEQQQLEQGTYQLAPHGTQGRFSSVDMAIRWTSQLGEYVNFNKDQNQEAKIEEIYKKFADKMKDIKFYGPGKVMTDGEWQAMRVNMETIFAERDQEIRAILSEEQLPKYDEFLKAMQQRKPE